MSITGFFRWALAAFMITAGVSHFTATEMFVAIMPDFIPYHEELVWLSGAMEIAFALGLLWRATRPAAGLCLIALYIAVFPANVNMAVNDIQPGTMDIPDFWLWARLPLQLVFIYWAWKVSRPDAETALAQAGGQDAGS